VSFLLKSDYGTQIKADLLNAVLDSNDAIRTDAELSAQAEIESYLRGRYDLSRIFVEVQPWAEATQFNAGAVVHHGTPARLYVATRASLNELPGAAVPVVEASESESTPASTQLEAPSPLEGGTPSFEGEGVLPAWKLSDPRHPLIKTYLIDCSLYLMHCRQNPRAVPQIRQDRYDAAIAWLNLCRAGKISPGLPPLPDVATDGTPNTQSIRPRGGSGAKKLQNSY
jgi:phage gp36-like protein